jgi:hypothetical protein
VLRTNHPARAAAPGPLVSLPTARFRSLIDVLAAHAQLPPWNHGGETWPAAVWLEGQVLQESSGNPRARRYEPALDRRPDGDTPGADDGAFEDDASYGLLQVLGSNIRAQLGIAPGVRMSFEFAYDPAEGLLRGIRHLQTECFRIAGTDVARALAIYNGGPRGTSLVPGPGGELVLRRQDYVDAVAKWAARVAAEQLA